MKQPSHAMHLAFRFAAFTFILGLLPAMHAQIPGTSDLFLVALGAIALSVVTGWNAHDE